MRAQKDAAACTAWTHTHTHTPRWDCFHFGRTCSLFSPRTRLRTSTPTPTHRMLSSFKALLLLSALCTPSSSLCPRLSHGRFSLLCDRQMAVGFRGDDDDLAGYAVEDEGWGSLILQSAERLSASPESESREKRTYNAAKSRFQSRAKLRGPLLRSRGKAERRSRLTLSLDVPTNIMNVLFDVAKAHNMRAKAAENARLLAQIGRRK
nr:uncharacterized protein LOC133605696 isoform X2 [Nerophis lumbriciformis]